MLSTAKHTEFQCSFVEHNNASSLTSTLFGRLTNNKEIFYNEVMHIMDVMLMRALAAACVQKSLSTCSSL